MPASTSPIPWCPRKDRCFLRPLPSLWLSGPRSQAGQGYSQISCLALRPTPHSARVEICPGASELSWFLVSRAAGLAGMCPRQMRSCVFTWRSHGGPASGSLIPHGRRPWENSLAGVPFVRTPRSAESVGTDFHALLPSWPQARPPSPLLWASGLQNLWPQELGPHETWLRLQGLSHRGRTREARGGWHSRWGPRSAPPGQAPVPVL